MNRRDFVKASLVAGFTLVLPKMLPVPAEAASDDVLRLHAGRVVDATGISQVDFGPDSAVTALHQQDGMWYARVERQGSTFWLKSTHGRVWGSLGWQSRRNLPVRQ